MLFSHFFHENWVCSVRFDECETQKKPNRGVGFGQQWRHGVCAREEEKGPTDQRGEDYQEGDGRGWKIRISISFLENTPPVELIKEIFEISTFFQKHLKEQKEKVGKGGVFQKWEWKWWLKEDLQAATGRALIEILRNHKGQENKSIAEHFMRTPSRRLENF